MKKTLLVLRHEIRTILSRPSFLFVLFGIPIIGAAVFMVAGQLSKGSSTQNVLSQLVGSQPKVEQQGYIDQSGIIKIIPAAVIGDRLIAYQDEASAIQAIKNEQISGYFIIPPDYLQSGKITSVQTDFTPIGSQNQSGLLEWLIKVNLLNGDIHLANLAQGPLNNAKIVSLSTAPQRQQSNMLTFFLPYAVTMLFYMIILSAASLLLNSVAKEKENRTMEILLLSVTPRQLLSGKIIGLGMLGLVQTIVWIGTGRILLARSGTTFNLPLAFQLPPSFLFWGLVFFVLGYALYASLMAGLGALVPNLREATQATIIVIFPLIIPIMLLSITINDPNGLPAVLLSLIPFTAPVSMMTRLSAGTVPLWQTSLSAFLLAFTAVIVVRSVARMFRAQTILSGQPFSRKLFVNALFGKA